MCVDMLTLIHRPGDLAAIIAVCVLVVYLMDRKR
jgi:hypothetical protein